MNHDRDLESELRQWLPAPPHSAPPALRTTILDRVTAELSRQRERRVTRRWALGAAGLLLLGICANLAVVQREEQRFETLCGPTPVSRPTRELLQAVADTSDKQTAAGLQEYLLAMQTTNRSSGEEFMRLYTEQLRQYAEAVHGIRPD